MASKKGSRVAKPATEVVPKAHDRLEPEHIAAMLAQESKQLAALKAEPTEEVTLPRRGLHVSPTDALIVVVNGVRMSFSGGAHTVPASVAAIIRKRIGAIPAGELEY